MMQPRASGSAREEDMLNIARYLCRAPSIRHSIPAGYAIKKGERVLLAVNNHYDSGVVRAIATAIRELGARADVMVLDYGPTRKYDELDEMRILLRNWDRVPEEPWSPWLDEHRQWEWLPRFADEEGYDLLIWGQAGPYPETRARYEGLPWFVEEVFYSAAFPYELWEAINRSTWETLWKRGKGGRVRITDPEGTDVGFTLHPEYWDLDRHSATQSRLCFKPEPTNGHLFMRPTAPFPINEDAEGVFAGTLNHFSSPFPLCRIHVSGARVVEIEGGGLYGDMIRSLEDDTRHVQYPEYPAPGLLWWWEAALGTHPKMGRPRNAFQVSRGGTLFERLRAGIMHMGFGTVINGPSEAWAKSSGAPLGHVHLHLQFPTYSLTTAEGEEIILVKDGHLAALDDAEVRRVAERFGEPDELLREAWTPSIPGVNSPGSYDDYAKDPASWTLDHESEVIDVTWYEGLRGAPLGLAD